MHVLYVHGKLSKDKNFIAWLLSMISISYTHNKHNNRNSRVINTLQVYRQWDKTEQCGTPGLWRILQTSSLCKLFPWSNSSTVIYSRWRRIPRSASSKQKCQESESNYLIWQYIFSCISNLSMKLQSKEKYTAKLFGVENQPQRIHCRCDLGSALLNQKHPGWDLAASTAPWKPENPDWCWVFFGE